MDSGALPFVVESAWHCHNRCDSSVSILIGLFLLLSCVTASATVLSTEWTALGPVVWEVTQTYNNYIKQTFRLFRADGDAFVGETLSLVAWLLLGFFVLV